MDFMTLLFFALGLGLLLSGGELLVRGASGLATAARLSPLVIGLTVVAMGTSAPELAVSVKATLTGQSDIATGNVVGSNIFNVLFILGASAMVAPLIVQQQLIRIDVPIMLGASLLVWGLSADGKLSWYEALLLVIGLALYTMLAVWMGRRETNKAVQQEYQEEIDSLVPPAPSNSTKRLLLMIGLVIGGLVLLVLGARWLVDSSVSMARAFGVSEVVIGLTIVAAGTSLPEVAASIVATLKGERDIAVGNVVGSNLFNLLGILGVAGLVGGTTGLTIAPSIVNFDLPVMTAVAAACLPIFFTGHRIARWEGVVFILYYVAYVTYLIMDVTAHDALPVFSSAMLWFVIPVTLLTLGIAVSRSLGKRKKRTV